jgi:hypothetical protein
MRTISPGHTAAIGALVSYKPASYAVAGGIDFLYIYHSVYLTTFTVGNFPNLKWVAF